MKYKESTNYKEYLYRFNQILSQMSYKMLNTSITNNITINFITTMIPHHQAAIYMCENLLDYTNYQPLQEIAKNIINMQTKGIEQMREIAMTTYGYSNNRRDVRFYEKNYFCITKQMICKMKNSLRSENINLNFVSEMIPHHEGAVQMCENLLKFSIDPRLANVAKNIIYEQSEGIRQLKEIEKMLDCNCMHT